MALIKLIFNLLLRFLLIPRAAVIVIRVLQFLLNLLHRSENRFLRLLLLLLLLLNHGLRPDTAVHPHVKALSSGNGRALAWGTAVQRLAAVDRLVRLGWHNLAVRL